MILIGGMTLPEESHARTALAMSFSHAPHARASLNTVSTAPLPLANPRAEKIRGTGPQRKPGDLSVIDSEFGGLVNPFTLHRAKRPPSAPGASANTAMLLALALAPPAKRLRRPARATFTQL